MARLGQHQLVKERFWRRMLRLFRQRRPRLAVRSFCVAYGLPEASFYAWRRTIAERDQQRRQVPRHAGRGPTVRPTPLAGCNHADERPLFVALAVPPSAAATAAPAALELVVGSGRIVRVPPGFDAATLRQLLAVLEEGPSC
jgi:hypothetical protein